ncbi:hypothetical protein BOX15_Mlig009372g2, partial [Macrostomum lignano]
QTGAPIEGKVTRQDTDANEVQCRLWRGYYVVDFTGIEDRLENLHCPSEFQPRQDDVLIWAYLKCGTHWLHEICHFLLSRQCHQRPVNKEKLMLEFVELPVLNAQPSPRLLNCHLPWPLLPKQILQSNGVKIICPIRNPKDVAVSLYHHYTRIADYKYNGKFQAFLKGLFVPGTLDGGSYFEHNEMLLASLASGELPADRVILVEYEQLKANPAEVIRKLDRFLMPEGASELTEELLTGICDAVGFDRMRRDRGSDMGHLFAQGEGRGTGFYRRGEVGDWRGYFNEADSLLIDELVAKHLGRFDQMYKPTYHI